MIRIIANCKFGYWNGTSVEIKTKNDAPFSVSSEREAELVELGLAAYVDEAPVQADVPQADADDDGDIEITAEYLNGLKLDKLKEFAEQFGIEYKPGTKKVDFVETIMAKLEADAEAQADTNADGDPDADTDDGDDAPTFDAGSAIE